MILAKLWSPSTAKVQWQDSRILVSDSSAADVMKVEREYEYNGSRQPLII